MKKVLILLVAILLLAGGCGGSSAENLDMDGAVNALDSKFSDMNDMDKSELLAIYDVDVTIFDKYVIKSSGLNNGDLFAIIKVSDENKDTAKKQLSQMFETLVNQSNLYSPEAVKKLNNRLETSVGNYLIYIVSSDNDALYETVKGFIS